MKYEFFCLLIDVKIVRLANILQFFLREFLMEMVQIEDEVRWIPCQVSCSLLQ